MTMTTTFRQHRLCGWSWELLLVIAVAATFRDYGLGWDDYTHSQYGDLLLKLYGSGFTDRRALSFDNLYFYGGGFDMEVLEQTPFEHVRWKVVDGPPEWIGTTIDFRLRQGKEQTAVLFQHQGWREPVEFMHHCSTKWATFLMSLKAMLEAGAGAPFPHDVHIAFGE